MRKAFFLTLCFGFILLNWLCFSADATEMKRVLILSSGGADMEWYQTIHSHMAQRFRRETERSEVFMEFLDLLRDNTEEYRQNLRRLLQHKYATTKFDLVVIFDLWAMKFVLDDLEHLFADTPIVFGFSSPKIPEKVRSNPRITGVLFEGGEYRSETTLKLALELHPSTRRVVVISGVDPHGRDEESLARKHFRAYQDRVQFSWLSGSSMNEILETVSHLSDYSVVIFLFLIEDEAGNTFLPLQAPQMIAKASTAPVYGLWDQLIGLGVVGGYMNSGKIQADLVANMSLRVLRGEKPSGIPYKRYGCKYMFDWRQLERWGIKETSLPPERIVRFREFSFWERYRKQIIGVSALILIQAMIIAHMIANRIKRQRVEKNLQMSEERFRAFMNHIPARVYMKDENSKLIYGNKRTLDHWGKKPDEWVGKTSYDLWPAELAERIEKRDRRVLSGDDQEAVDEFSIDHKGETQCLRDIKFPINISKDKRVIGGIVIDVTGLKRAEEELAERLRFERLLADLSADFIDLPADRFDTAITGGIKQVVKFLGVAQGALRQFSKDMSHLQCTHFCTVEGVEPFPKDIEVKRTPYFMNKIRGGQVFYLSYVAALPEEATAERLLWDQLGVRTHISIPLAVGGAVSGVLTFSSLSSDRSWSHDMISRIQILGQIFANALIRKEFEEKLVQSERQLRLIADSLPVFISYIDRDQRYQFSNIAYEKMFGIPREKIKGSHIKEILGDRIYGHIQQYLERALLGEEVRYEISEPFPDGSVRNITVIYRPHMDKNGKVLGFYALAQDITEQKKAQLELQRQRDRLSHMMRVATMGELTASIAHELRQPLTAILNNAGAALRFLRRDRPDLGEVKEILEDIIVDTTRASEVILKLRELMKRGPVAQIPIDINEVIREVIALTRSDAIIKNVSTAADLESKRLYVLADRVQIQQVIINLIMNAIEAMMDLEPDSRRLFVRTSLDRAGTITVSVRDQGEGLGDKRVEDIFEAFYTTKQQGLGMGLSINKSIIEAHGGRIWATNNPDRGTTFSFCLPCHKNG